MLISVLVADTVFKFRAGMTKLVLKFRDHVYSYPYHYCIESAISNTESNRRSFLTVL